MQKISKMHNKSVQNEIQKVGSFFQEIGNKIIIIKLLKLISQKQIYLFSQNFESEVPFRSRGFDI